MFARNASNEFERLGILPIFFLHFPIEKHPKLDMWKTQFYFLSRENNISKTEKSKTHYYVICQKPREVRTMAGICFLNQPYQTTVSNPFSNHILFLLSVESQGLGMWR